MTKELRAKPLIKEVYSNLKEEILSFGKAPRMVVVMIGADPASLYYVNSVQKRAKKIGAEVIVEAHETMDEKTLLDLIHKLNNDNEVNAIMLQKPLPKDVDEEKIVEAIDPMKDVDGFHPLNVGNMLLGKDSFVPCTPAAVIEIMKYYEIKSEGKEVVVIGRSDIVGKPMATLLLRKGSYGNATVTVCHSRTNDLASVVKRADIVIAAIGRANFITADMVKPEAVVLDVGVNEIIVDGNAKYVGDVDYNQCFEKVNQITPVPGGVGSVTTAMLLKNLVKAYKMQN